MRILTPNDGGRIRLVARGADRIDVALRADPGLGVRHWFSFVVEDDAPVSRWLRFVDIERATYPDAFVDTCISACFDGEEWERLPATREGADVVVRHEPRGPRTHYAWFVPYSARRRRRRFEVIEARGAARVVELGKSLQGFPVCVIVAGDGPAPIWVVARQHPGETMAEWAAEGFVDRLLDGADEVASALRRRATVHVVPCVNVDGAAAGYHRVNARGHDLNRSWIDVEEREIPEVAAVRRALDDTGVRLFLDVHGDERSRVGFIAGCEGNPGYDDRVSNLERRFEAILVGTNGDMGTERGYPLDAPGQADLGMAANFVGEAHACLALTVELPAMGGFDHDRARGVGYDLLEPALACLDDA